jgi:6-phosphogluconolactonase/glucosamine-6-phosphate isomerase/deaminase
MRLVILDDYDRVSEWAAKYVRNRILAANPGPNNYFVLGLPTGIFNLHINNFVIYHSNTILYICEVAIRTGTVRRV